MSIPPAEADDRLVDREHDQGVVLQDDANLAVFLFTLHRLDGDRSEEHRETELRRSGGVSSVTLIDGGGFGNAPGNRANWRSPPDCSRRRARNTCVRYCRRDGAYLTDLADRLSWLAEWTVAAAARAPVRWVGGACLSRYLIAMLRGLDPAKSSANTSRSTSASIAPSTQHYRYHCCLHTDCKPKKST